MGRGGGVGWGGGGSGEGGCEQRIEVFVKIPYIFTRESSHCTLQADKSFEPLPIILSEISHLQNCRVQNSKKGNNSKSIT